MKLLLESWRKYLVEAQQVVLVVMSYHNGLYVGALGQLNHLTGVGRRVDENAVVGLWADQEVRVVAVGPAHQLVNGDNFVLEMWRHDVSL